MGDFLRSSLFKRLVSAGVLIPLTLLSIWVGGTVFAAFLGVAAVRALYEWWRMAKHSPFQWPIDVLGAVYVVLSFYLAYELRDGFGFWPAMMFFMVVWASDIGAYFAGKILRGPKMGGEISPNKTWAGYVGALVSPGLALMALMMQADALLFFAGAAIGITGQAGDLLISSLKRHVGAKDTGHLIPGHGGILDRVDSLMLSVPVFLLIARDLL